MAEKDIAERTFMSLDDVFADIFNVLVFRGERVVKEEELTEGIIKSQYKADDDTLHEQERDTHKIWHRSGMNLILAGIENQTAPDKDMPFRVISYDGASYRGQLLKTEQVEENGVIKQVAVKERYPVITIVLYFGKDKWNCSTHLKDCFYPGLREDAATLLLNEYIQDYKAHVFDIPRLSEELVQKFQSDFNVVAEYFTNVYTNPKYKPKERVIRHVDEFLKLMRVLTGDSEYEKNVEELKQEGAVTMCRVLDYHKELGLTQGITQGITQGEERLSKLIQRLITDNLYDIIALVTSDQTEKEKYYQKYGI